MVGWEDRVTALWYGIALLVKIRLFCRMLSSISGFKHRFCNAFSTLLSGRVKGTRKMAHKHGKSTAFSCNAAARCSLSAIIWSLAAWILLIHAYNILTPPNSSNSEPQTQEKRLSMYREYEEIEDRAFEVKLRGQKFLSSIKQRGRRFSVIDDFLDVASQRRSLYFPEKNLAVNPLKAEEKDVYYFYPGREWRDTSGRPIQAHGGGIMYVEETRTFYWYGENKDGRTYHLHRTATARVDIIGVSCYSSKDLWAWKNEGIVLSGEKTNKTHDLHVSNVLERPKVIYNDRTKQYVMWMHIDNANYSKASVGVAVSSSPSGPFQYLGSKRPHGFDSRDMTVFKDDNGEAYIVYSSEDNTELHIGQLTEDYMDLKHAMRRALVGEHREAPAVFKHGGLYYMITSGCTGWAPNSPLVHSAESMLGPWETLGNPCVGGNEDFRATTFFAQGTFVQPLPGVPDTFIFMADRWNPADLRDSRYVWLPLTMDGPADEPLEDDFEFPLWSRVSIYWHKNGSFQRSGIHNYPVKVVSHRQHVLLQYLNQRLRSFEILFICDGQYPLQACWQALFPIAPVISIDSLERNAIREV